MKFARQPYWLALVKNTVFPFFHFGKNKSTKNIPRDILKSKALILVLVSSNIIFQVISFDNTSRQIFLSISGFLTAEISQRQYFLQMAKF